MDEFKIVVFALFAFYLVSFGLAIFIFNRVHRVHSFLVGMLEMTADLCRKDIDEGRDYRVRLNIFDEQFDFDEMAMKFWKPLNSFVKDDRFLKDGPINKEQ